MLWFWLIVGSTGSDGVEGYQEKFPSGIRREEGEDAACVKLRKISARGKRLLWEERPRNSAALPRRSSGCGVEDLRIIREKNGCRPGARLSGGGGGRKKRGPRNQHHRKKSVREEKGEGMCGPRGRPKGKRG